MNDLRWAEWGDRFNYFLQRVARVYDPEHFIIGGGVSKKFHKFSDRLDTEADIRIAQFKYNAGIIGAALAAVEQRG